MSVDSLLNRRYLQVSGSVRVRRGVVGRLGLELGLAQGLQLGIGIGLGVTIAGRLYLRLGVTIASAFFISHFIRCPFSHFRILYVPVDGTVALSACAFQNLVVLRRPAAIGQ